MAFCIDGSSEGVFDKMTIRRWLIGTPWLYKIIVLCIYISACVPKTVSLIALRPRSQCRRTELGVVYYNNMLYIYNIILHYIILYSRQKSDSTDGRFGGLFPRGAHSYGLNASCSAHGVLLSCAYRPYSTYI